MPPLFHTTLTCTLHPHLPLDFLLTHRASYMWAFRTLKSVGPFIRCGAQHYSGNTCFAHAAFARTCSQQQCNRRSEPNEKGFKRRRVMVFVAVQSVAETPKYVLDGHHRRVVRGVVRYKRLWLPDQIHHSVKVRKNRNMRYILQTCAL